VKLGQGHAAGWRIAEQIQGESTDGPKHRGRLRGSGAIDWTGSRGTAIRRRDRVAGVGV
jgi:hypothetical protein